MALATRYSGLRVHLLGNEKIFAEASQKLINFTPVEDFYDPEEFKEAAKRISYAHSFRDGFWLKSLERFFVLEQYIHRGKIEHIFHAELDQLLFRADQLLEKLDTADQRGLFFPFHNQKSAVASVFYCNDHKALRSLLDFSCKGDIFPNEMALMANWAAINPTLVHALPTMALSVNHINNLLNESNSGLGVNDIGGVVDAAQLGQWVGGIDPRNVSIREVPMTKFVDAPGEMLLSRDQLSRFKFNLNSEGNLIGKFDELFSVNIYNLHLHSKVHKYLLNSDPELDHFFCQANEDYPVALPGTRKTQVIDYLLSRIKYIVSNPQGVITRVNRRLNHLFKRRPISHPFISGDTFRSIADHVWEEGNQVVKPATIRGGDIIFCESEKLSQFQEKILNKIDVPIVLILGNSDENHSHQLSELFTGGNIRTIFAQNLMDSASGVEPLPIGLENAWRANHGVILAFRYLRTKHRSRIYRIMWTFTIGTNADERTKAANSLINFGLADKLGSLSPQQHRDALSRYAFVASPPGNGLDTHRTWEAMYLGCVPVVLKSHMTDHFESLGLPIWVVDSYNEINEFSDAQFKEKYEELMSRFTSKALWSPYWVEKIKSYSR
jgi:hypothetical protein